MEIKIDTKKDSPEDIRKAIEFLKRIADSGTGESYGSSEIGTGEDVASGMAGLFGDTPVLESDESSDQKKTDDKDDENIQIMPY